MNEAFNKFLHIVAEINKDVFIIRNFENTEDYKNGTHDILWIGKNGNVPIAYYRNSGLNYVTYRLFSVFANGDKGGEIINEFWFKKG